MPDQAKALEVELIAIEISNLRGFRGARMDLREGLTLLVGPNNSGKTSILRMLDWIINRADETVLRGEQHLGASEVELLVPARSTGGSARRITLELSIGDGRHARRFLAQDNVARLRVGVSAEGRVRLNVGPPKRSEPPDDGRALELLEATRRSTEFGLVPASRDASSETFRAALRDAVVARLEERAIHARRAGAPTEYRQVRKALNELERIGKDLVAPLWDEMRTNLPPGLAERGELKVSVSPEAFVPWLAEHVALRLVTGEHDASSVAPIEVGSGLQSLLELATQQAAATQSGQRRILAIEEPEAFLHPSAQRSLARLIRRNFRGKLIVSTHSPLLVEEAEYGEVVLVRDHRFFQPQELDDDETRRAINTALLAGFGAEVAFARTVLLIEGEGDRLFFEGLRRCGRRIAQASNDGCVDEMYVLPTGSKTAFAPWLRLLRSYGRENDRPVSWLAAPDSDAATEIRRAWREAGIALPAHVESTLSSVAEAAPDDPSAKQRAVRRANSAMQAAGVGISLLYPDLEGAMLGGCQPATIRWVADLVGAPLTENTTELEGWLRKRKAPWMRAAIADEIPWSELSRDVRAVLRRWLSNVAGGSRVAELLRSPLD